MKVRIKDRDYVVEWRYENLPTEKTTCRLHSVSVGSTENLSQDTLLAEGSVKRNAKDRSNRSVARKAAMGRALKRVFPVELLNGQRLPENKAARRVFFEEYVKMRHGKW